MPQITALLERPQSTVSAVIVKWKCLGAATAQNGSAQVERKNRLSSVATLTTEFRTASRSQVSTITVPWERHEMGFHGRAAAHKPKIAIGRWSSGNAFTGGMNQALPSGSLTDKSGFGGCQENATCPNA